jgi:hypothetical protein
MKYSPQRLGKLFANTEKWQDALGKLVNAIEAEFQRLSDIQDGDDRVGFAYEVNRGYVHGGGLPSSYYYAGFGAGTALTTGAPSANVLRAIPFVAPGRNSVISRLAFNVTANVAATSARIGLYKSKSETDIYPGELVAESANIGTASNGVKTYDCKVALEPLGIYWIAIVGNGAPTLRCGTVAGSTVPGILPDDDTMPTTRSLGLSVAHTFGALPNPFTVGAAYITAVPIPVLAYRFSE